MSGHSRQTPALQLCGSQHRDSDEVKDSHARRWGDHRARHSDHRASSVESVARASGADRPAELLGINPHLGIALVRGKAGSGLGAQESVTD